MELEIKRSLLGGRVWWMQNFPLVPKSLFWYNINGLFPWERIIGKRGH